MIQLVVVDEVTLSPARQALGLSFIVRYRLELEVL
jgi:hypothetical protein